MKGISPTFSHSRTDVFRFIDMLISFCGQKVKGQTQGHSRSVVNTISEKPINENNFAQFWSQM